MRKKTPPPVSPISTAITRRLARENSEAYDAPPFVARIQALLAARNETYREAALRAGLDHSALWRIVENGHRPRAITCILLADHFEVNPNELLAGAGHPPLKAFDTARASAEHLPPEALEVALALAKMPDPAKRKAVATAITTLIQKYFE